MRADLPMTAGSIVVDSASSGGVVVGMFCLSLAVQYSMMMLFGFRLLFCVLWCCSITAATVLTYGTVPSHRPVSIIAGRATIMMKHWVTSSLQAKFPSTDYLRQRLALYIIISEGNTLGRRHEHHAA
jgi:hypothetical protein